MGRSRGTLSNILGHQEKYLLAHKIDQFIIQLQSERTPVDVFHAAFNHTKGNYNNWKNISFFAIEVSLKAKSIFSLRVLRSFHLTFIFLGGALMWSGFLCNQNSSLVVTNFKPSSAQDRIFST